MSLAPFEANDLVTFELSVRTKLPDGTYHTRGVPVRARLLSVAYDTYATTVLVQTMDGIKHMLYIGRIKKVLPPVFHRE